MQNTLRKETVDTAKTEGERHSDVPEPVLSEEEVEAHLAADTDAKLYDDGFRGILTGALMGAAIWIAVAIAFVIFW